MKKMNIHTTRTAISVLLLLLALLLFATRCNSNKKETIIIALTPTEAERSNQRSERITAYLSKKLGREVKHIMVSNPSAAIEAMRAKKIHIASGGPFTYLVAAEKAGAEAIVTTVMAEGVENFYRSLLITHVDNHFINNMDEIKMHAKTLSLTWGYPTSNSGHLVPRFELQKKGIYPEDFKEIFTAPDQTSAMFSVLSKKIDIAAVSYTGLRRLIAENRIKKEDIKILWMSEPMMYGAIFVRKDFDPALRILLQQAYIDLKKDDPETWQVLRNQYALDVEYVAVDDSEFEHFRAMARQIKGLDFEF